MITDIIMEEYSRKLGQLKNGILSEEEWMNYCQTLMSEVLEDAKDVMMRLKERGD
jgi:hypothetical protein